MSLQERLSKGKASILDMEYVTGRPGPFTPKWILSLDESGVTIQSVDTGMPGTSKRKNIKQQHPKVNVYQRDTPENPPYSFSLVGKQDLVDLFNSGFQIRKVNETGEVILVPISQTLNSKLGSGCAPEEGTTKRPEKILVPTEKLTS